MPRNDEYIYVVLVKALTGLGKFARFFSKYEYTHIAVCMDENLDDFITFSRKYHNSPFDSGFMHETLDCYAFGDNTEIKLKVFKVPVTPEGKRDVQEYISRIGSDDDYLFNLYSMATMSLFHGFRIYKAHNCMSFVARIIEQTGAVPMNRKYYKYNIKDMDILLTDYFFKEEYFVKTSIGHEDYMKPVNFFRNAGLFIRLNAILTVRLIFKWRRIDD